MAIPAGSQKFVISGTLGGGEVFQTAFWSTFSDISNVTDANLALMAAGAPFVGLMNAAKLLMNTSSSYTALDSYAYAGGTAAAAHAHATLAVVGTGASNHPNQCAHVVTLRTATAGRRGRGRMYFPANGSNHSGASGLINGAQSDGLVDALGVLFQSLSSAGAPAVVVSQTGGTRATVTSVDADYVPDTQRRRSNKLHSIRHSHAAV